MRRSLVAIDPWVTLLDVGGTPQFAKSRDAARWVIECVGDPLPRKSLQVITTTNKQEMTDVMLTRTRLLHVMAHGTTGRLEPDHRTKLAARFSRRFRVDVLTEYCRMYDVWPDVDVLMLDACNTFTEGWIRDLAHVIPQGRSVLFLGTTESVTWPRATAYTNAFYTALLRLELDGSSEDFTLAARTAHRAATRAFRILCHDDPPFRIRTIHGRGRPSR